jgi:DnaJ family protein B protein 6
MNGNLYEILGLDRSATAEHVKKAYKRKALDTHPDKLPAGASPEDRTRAEEQFRLVNNAYEVLRNPENRRLYDTHGVWPPPQGGTFNAPGPSSGFGATNDWSFSNDPFFSGGGRPSMFSFTDPFVLFENMFHDSFRHAQNHHTHNHHPHRHDYEHHHPGTHSHSARERHGHSNRHRGHTNSMFDDDFGFRMNESFFGAPPPGFNTPSPMFGNPPPGFGSMPFMSGGFNPFGGFPFGPGGFGGGGFGGGVHETSSTSYSSGGGGGGRWVSESRVTNVVNGQRTSVWKRTDSEGNEHITRTLPDGTETYHINGVEQVPSSQRIEGRHQDENLIEASSTHPSGPPPPYHGHRTHRVSNNDPPFIPPENDVSRGDGETSNRKKWWGFR